MGIIRVLIADDHPVVRQGIRGMLEPEPGIEVAGEARSADEAVAKVQAEPYDVILMDLRMPGGDGLDAIPRILAIRPQTRIIVLTSYEKHADVLRSIADGAAGYLLKDTSTAGLAAGIRSVCRGETVLAPTAATRLASQVRAPGSGLLSPRETEVLRHVAMGLSNTEIGERLLISDTTVKTHIMRIFAKLGVSDRTAAVTRALARGLLPPP